MAASNRIVFGDEIRAGSGVVQYVPIDTENCPACGVRRGRTHEAGCPLEQCPRCGELLTHCGHKRTVLR